jgi:hypothetical protein
VRSVFKSHLKTLKFGEPAETKISFSKGFAAAAVIDSPLVVRSSGLARVDEMGSGTYQYWPLLLNRKYLPSGDQMPARLCSCLPVL